MAHGYHLVDAPCTSVVNSEVSLMPMITMTVKENYPLPVPNTMYLAFS